ncbi:Neurobeachin Lysosomal-trafficking regulator 2 Protein BCL8B [Channa argus]|uniref:Neurobeachin Lysosomal-trafficking regulator 2 Protein BCL8B n=1 Tax=Channa argus TaxID=215402 RepID=A0A6G1QTZ1_CHAAH|nr:Neurobeachin Lysosomal-trafficking regulator 2 Protein BCL8B [Channa argus]
MSSEKPVSAPPGSASSLTDTDRDSHPPPGSSVQQQQPQPQQQQQKFAAGAGSGATGERMVSAAGSMVLPAGVINPAVPIRNIQMKFAVLVGLIQVGEVSNRDIVETVLNLIGEVIFLHVFCLFACATILIGG